MKWLMNEMFIFFQNFLLQTNFLMVLDNQQGSAAAQTEDDSSNGISLQNPIVFYSLIAALAVAVLIICCSKFT